MPTSPELMSARLLVHQGVGRNLLQFQRLELLLKHLLERHQGSYTPETMDDEMKRREKAQEKKTLGNLASDWFEKVLFKPSHDDFLPADDAKDGQISHRFGITIAEEIHQGWRSQLKALVDERNVMVHSCLLTWDLTTIEGCQAVVAELDEQRGRIEIELERVKGFRESMIKIMKVFHEETMANEGP